MSTGTMPQPELADTVRYLTDRLEIQDLVARYGLGQDLHQHAGDNNVLEQWDDVFTDDATVDCSASGGPAAGVGVRALAEHMRGPGLRGGGTMSVLSHWQHLEGLPLVTITGDTATAKTSHFHTHEGATAAEPGWNLMEAGIFHDDLVRTPQGWRIRHRRLEIHWLGTFATRGLPR